MKTKNRQLNIFDGSEIRPERLEKRNWFRRFRKYCEKNYENCGESFGFYCCGYDWMCDECKMRFQRGCSDCVKTFKEILLKGGIKIDYTDYDFEKWEKLAYTIYRRKMCKRRQENGI